MVNKLRKSFVAVSVAVTILFSPLLVGGESSVSAETNDEEQVSSLNDSFAGEAETIFVNGIGNKKRTVNFDSNWRFVEGEQGGAEATTYNDSSWQLVNLPHDYSLTKSYTQSGEAESGYKLGGVAWYRKSFTINASARNKRVFVNFGGIYMNATIYINGIELARHPYGYTPFSVDITDNLNFDSENVLAVKVEHHFPSSRWYSGSGIYRSVNLTFTNPVHVATYGVKVTTPNLETQANSQVDVNIKTIVQNQSQADATVKIRQKICLANTDTAIAEVESAEQTLTTLTSQEFEQTLQVNNPKLWSLNSPTLYAIHTDVLVNGEVVDSQVTRYGFRYFKFDADKGFSLNGQAMKLQGVCMHHDQGALGAKAYRRAIERQLEILKEMGVNAVRVTHNPAADELIELADTKGMLLIEEAFDTWVKAKNGNRNDYATWYKQAVGADNQLVGASNNMTWAEFDLKTMVRRGFNSPSIIMWSLGNEVMEGMNGPFNEYPSILEQLVQWTQAEDTSRPVTLGDNKLKADWSESKRFAETLTKANGTVGFNYADGAKLDTYHRNNPTWHMYASETASAINTRGYYKSQKNDTTKKLTSYDTSTVGWGMQSAQSWYTVLTRDFMAGEFVWTGFDYLGEPTPWNNTNPGQTGGWPSPKSSYFGIVDTAGIPKDRYYFYQSQWRKDITTLHVLPIWQEDAVNKDRENKVKVDVYSNAAAVELFFTKAGSSEADRQSLGKKTFTQKQTAAGYKYQIYEQADKSNKDYENLYLSWSVPYEDGTLTAVAYDANDEVIQKTSGRHTVRTTGQAASLQIEADRANLTADDKDLSYIKISVLDANGQLVETADNEVTVTVSGAGRLLGMDNGDPVDHTTYDAGRRKAMAGQLIAIVQADKVGGTINVQVAAEGLTGQQLTLSSTKALDESANTKEAVSYTMPKNYYVKLGKRPSLASETLVRFSDGSTETFALEWDKSYETDGSLSKDHSFVARGKISQLDLPITANVNVISQVAGLLNYAIAVPKMTPIVSLPLSRPLILADGTVLTTEFPVTWEAQTQGAYDQVGVVTIKGEATVFGEKKAVTASVRVADATTSIGANVANAALSKEQSVPNNLQEGTLSALTDGQTDATQGKWSTEKLAQTGERTAELTFTYATAQSIGAVNLHGLEDAMGAKRPEQVEVYWALTGGSDASWNKLETVPEKLEPDTNGHYTYKLRFGGVSAVALKIKITAQKAEAEGKKPYIDLSEVEILLENSQFDINKSADLTEMTVNGEKVTAPVLKSKQYKTAYHRADIVAKSTHNAAITVLPAYNDVIRILTESEDHKQRAVYAVYLKQKDADELKADDASRDYPESDTTPSAGASQNDNRAKDVPQNAVDGKPNTIWHTPWGGTKKDNFWLQLELKDATNIEALRYLSRGGETNGIVKDYEVEYSLDGTNWTSCAKGTWTNDRQKWNLAQFTQPVKAKFIRLKGLSTYGDGGQNDKFMSAAEVRVRVAVEKTDLSQAEVALDKTEFAKTGQPITPSVTVKLADKELQAGIDYYVKCENNIEVGQASLQVIGIVKYKGSVTKNFTIVQARQVEPKPNDSPSEIIRPHSSILSDSAEKGTGEIDFYDFTQKVKKDNYTIQIGRFKKKTMVLGKHALPSTGEAANSGAALVLACLAFVLSNFGRKQEK